MKRNYHSLTKVSVAVLVFSILLTSCGGNKATEKNDASVSGGLPIAYVRKNASSPEAAADLAALNLAIGKMKQLTCDSVRSWYYQGAIHSVPNVVARGNPLCVSYTQMSQMKTAWMNCTHDPLGASELHFLLWHRLYIWHLEKIVRELSGKKDFALPYWDYTDPRYRVMPALFRSTSDSLYEKARLKSLNAGLPIDSSMKSRLDMTNNNENKLYALFNSNVDTAPHGAIHNYVGGGYANDSTMWNRIYQGLNYGLMAQVESAAFDPIFWVHHANIDYLWQKWETDFNGPKPVLDDLIAQPWAYVFFNPDGTKIEYSVEEAYKQAFSMDYKYDVLKDAPKMLQAKQPVPENRKEILSAKVEQLIDQPQKKLIVKAATAPTIQMLKSLDLSKKVTILEVTVGFSKQPRQDYEVYIDTDTANPAKLAGIMTFFGAMHMQEPGDQYTKVFRFDISAEYDLKKSTSNLRLLIVNSSGRKATELTVKNVRIETRDF